MEGEGGGGRRREGGTTGSLHCATCVTIDKFVNTKHSE